MSQENDQEFQPSPELSRKIKKADRAKSILDWIRRALIGIIVAGGLWILDGNGVHWGWLVAWAIGGFILTLNLVGFATLPLYVMVAKYYGVVDAVEDEIQERYKP